MYIYMDSNACSETYPANNPGSFTNDLSQVLVPYFSEVGGYSLALCEILLPAVAKASDYTRDDMLYVYCSVCTDSILHKYKQPILRCVSVGETRKPGLIRFNPLLPVPISETNINSITIDIRDSLGKPVSFAHKTATYCTLQLTHLTKHHV